MSMVLVNLIFSLSDAANLRSHDQPASRDRQFPRGARYSVDVGLVADERLRSLAGADVPELCCGVASARDEDALTGAE